MLVQSRTAPRPPAFNPGIIPIDVGQRPGILLSSTRKGEPRPNPLCEAELLAGGEHGNTLSTVVSLA